MPAKHTQDDDIRTGSGTMRTPCPRPEVSGL